MPNREESHRNSESRSRESGTPRTGEDGGHDGADSERTSIWEWVAAGVGALLVVAAIGFVSWQAISEPDHAVPMLTVSVDSVARHADRHVVRFTVRNAGAATAAGVRVDGTLRSGDVVVETSSATVDYVPAHSRRTAGVIFTRDPRGYQLELRPVGWQDP